MSRFGREYKKASSGLSEGGILGLEKSLVEHDREMLSRKNRIIENLKKLCDENGIKYYNLTGKKFDEFVKQYPDQFYYLSAGRVILKTHFQDSIKTLIESLERAKEKE